MTGIALRHYDAEAHATAVAREAELREELDTVSCRIRDLTDTDKTPDAPASRTYHDLTTLHGALTREVGLARDNVSRYQEVQPRRERTEDPFGRFCRDGINAITSEERAEHVVVGELGSASMPKMASGLTPEFLKGVVLPGNPRDTAWYIEDMAEYDPQATLRSDQTPGGEDWTETRLYDSLQYADTLKHFGGMINATSELVTDTGTTMDFAVLNDASEEGQWFADQASAAQEQDIQGLDNVELETQVITSKRVNVSLALMADTPFDMGRLVQRRLDRRIARGCNKGFTTGNGAAKKPRGFTIDSKQGHVTATNNAFTTDELLQLLDNLDPAYLEGEGSPMGLDPPMGATFRGFMFNQSTLGTIRRFKGTDGHFLWRPGLAGLQYADPPSVAGFPYRLNQHMASVAANAKIVGYGNFGYYLRRRARYRISARFFDSGVASGYQVQFIAFERHGGRFVGGLTDTTNNECEAVVHLAIKA